MNYLNKSEAIDIHIFNPEVHSINKSQQPQQSKRKSKEGNI